MHERDGFAAEAVGKSLFHCQNAAPAMVWSASSDFWKAPLVSTKNGTAATQAMKIKHLSTLVTTSVEQRNTC